LPFAQATSIPANDSSIVSLPPDTLTTFNIKTRANLLAPNFYPPLTLHCSLIDFYRHRLSFQLA
jgi:hypothetical protein